MILFTIAGLHRLASNAAASYARMLAMGMPTGGINSSYRDPKEQERLFLERYRVQWTGKGPYGDARWWKGKRYVRHSPLGMVAAPGKSQHETGLALDLATDSAAHAWMLKNGAAHGWVRNIPSEPWHWEYRPALDKKPTPPRDWFDMATEAELRKIIAEELDRRVVGKVDDRRLTVATIGVRLIGAIRRLDASVKALTEKTTN